MPVECYRPQDAPAPGVHEGDYVVRVPFALFRHLRKGFKAWLFEQGLGNPAEPSYATLLRYDDLVIIPEHDDAEGN